MQSNVLWTYYFIDARRLIYEVGMSNNIKVSDKWYETKLAGIEYLYNLEREIIHYHGELPRDDDRD